MSHSLSKCAWRTGKESPWKAHPSACVYAYGCEFGGSSSATKKTRQSKGAKLTSFEVTVQEGNTALLSWEAKSETNLAIEFVEGAGTTKKVGGAGFEPATPCL